MKRCREIVPVDRPTFRQLHIHTSRHIEHIAGYFEIGYNRTGDKVDGVGDRIPSKSELDDMEDNLSSQ